jgi:hypothetical protein
MQHMKKSIKKLTINKSTVTNMTGETLQQVKGGTGTTDLSLYPCPSEHICVSAGGGCYTARLSCVYRCKELG